MVEHDVTTILSQAIADQVFPGCVLGIIQDAEPVLVKPFGRLTYDVASAVVTEDTIYDVASLTKSIPTASLLLSLLDEGKVRLNDTVIKFIPELGCRYREMITIKHLLTYTLVFPFSVSELKDKLPNEILNEIFHANLTCRPGERFVYTNATSIIMGILIERIAQKRLDVLADEIFFSPLGMKDTTFHPEKLANASVAPTEIDSWRGREIQAEVHDESTYALSPLIVAGSAGLFSTAPDLLKFLQMLLQQGMFDGRQSLTPKILTEAFTNQIAAIGESTGLGWELHQPWYMGQFSNEHTFGKTGFTGCVIVGDPQRKRGFVLLSNATYPQRRKDKIEINAVRKSIADIVFA